MSGNKRGLLSAEQVRGHRRRVCMVKPLFFGSYLYNDDCFGKVLGFLDFFESGVSALHWGPVAGRQPFCRLRDKPLIRAIRKANCPPSPRGRRLSRYQKLVLIIKLLDKGSVYPLRPSGTSPVTSDGGGFHGAIRLCIAEGNPSTKLLRSFAYGTAQDDSVFFLRATARVAPTVLATSF